MFQIKHIVLLLLLVLVSSCDRTDDAAKDVKLIRSSVEHQNLSDEELQRQHKERASNTSSLEWDGK